MIAPRTCLFYSKCVAAGRHHFLISNHNLHLHTTKLSTRGIYHQHTMAVDDVPVRINDKHYRVVKEGQASILAPYQKDLSEAKTVVSQVGNPRNNNEGHQAVFYNPIQQYNRDLTVLAILIYGESAIAIKQSKYRADAPRRRKKPKKTVSNNQPRTDVSREPPNQPVQQIPQSKKRTANDAGIIDENEKESDAGNAKKARTDGEVKDNEEGELEVREGAIAPDTTTSSNAHPQNGAIASESQNSNVKARQPRQIPFTILDALSASGLRAIRYAKEIPFATAVVANDLLSEAVDAIKLNIEHNGVIEKVLPNVGDARHLMYSTTGNEHLSRIPGNIHKFDVVDLDPYGTAAPFLDAALQSLVDEGLLCVTCTDAGVWASNGYPEKAFALYNGIPVKGSHSHEAGLRLILHAIASTAARYGIAIEPLLSLSIDFYGRLFIRVHKSQQDVKQLSGTSMLVYNCDQGCGAWEIQPLARNQEKKAKNGEIYYKHGFSQAPTADKYCEHCGTKSHLGGPMWAGPLHNPVFIQKILGRLPLLDKTVYGTIDRLKGMLTVALEEEVLDWQPIPTSSEPSVGKAANIPETGDSSAVVGVQEKSQTVKATDNSRLTSAIIPRLPPNMLSPSPFFFLPTYLAKVLSAPTPAEDPIRGALLSLGYTCTRSHCKPGSLKTNATWAVIWEVMREWLRQESPDKLPRLLGEGEFAGKPSVKKSSPGWTILQRLRGRGDSLQMARLRESLLAKLGHGSGSAKIGSRDEMRTLLQSALYELDHPVQNLNVQNLNEVPVGNGEGTNGHQQLQTNSDDVNMKGGLEADTTACNTNTKESTLQEQPKRITGKALIESGGDPSELEIVFDAKLGRASRDMTGKLVRYQINPRANWGPMVRAGTGSLR